MSEVLETGVILSFDEFRILLYGMGIRSIEGVYMEDKSCTDEEVVRALYHMSEQGIISAAEDEGFLLRDDIQEILWTVGYPEQTWIYRPNEKWTGIKTGPEFYCYRAEDKVVVSERYWKKKEAVKLQLFSEETYEIWKEQMDDDYRGD